MSAGQSARCDAVSTNSVEAKWDHERSVLSAPTHAIALFRHNVDFCAWCQVRLVGEDIS